LSTGPDWPLQQVADNHPARFVGIEQVIQLPISQPESPAVLAAASPRPE
jgi:hypothetical protein